MNLFEWIEAELEPQLCTSDAFIYDHMESQSNCSLPLIYQPFDVEDRGHWRDRGACFDFLFSTQGQGRRLLDFGPGDGWPSLIVAPYAGEVVGVDGSRRRVQVCRENAVRLGLGNTHFLHAAPGSPLPLEDDSFDGAMAASSIEQTPDPKSTLRELWRVLRPGGRLRISYEALGRYRGGREQEIWTWPVDAHNCRLILYDRDVEGERAVQYSLAFALSAQELAETLIGKEGPLAFADIGVAGLERARPALVETRVCRTIHPSGPTWAAWLREAGFDQVLPSHNGLYVSGQLYDRLPREQHPRSMEELDTYLGPIVQAVVELPAPAERDPCITAIK